MQQLNEKATRLGKRVHLCFIDMEKDFERVQRENIWRVLEDGMVGKDLNEHIKTSIQKLKST